MLARVMGWHRGERPTRFHTERGRLMPVGAWLSIPSVVSHRIAGLQTRSPWMVPSAVSFISRRIEPHWRVFEFGSGSSTVWYAARAAEIYSLEDDPVWYEIVSGQLRANGLNNCRLKLASLRSFPDYIKAFDDDAFDLVVVDSNEAKTGDRISCLEAARPKVKPGGLLVLDDSDRPSYQMAPELLRGWPLQRFAGLKPLPLIAVETSIFQRPQVGSRPSWNA